MLKTNNKQKERNSLALPKAPTKKDNTATLLVSTQIHGMIHSQTGA